MTAAGDDGGMKSSGARAPGASAPAHGAPAPPAVPPAGLLWGQATELDAGRLPTPPAWAKAAGSVCLRCRGCGWQQGDVQHHTGHPATIRRARQDLPGKKSRGLVHLDCGRPRAAVLRGPGPRFSRRHRSDRVSGKSALPPAQGAPRVGAAVCQKREQHSIGGQGPPTSEPACPSHSTVCDGAALKPIRTGWSPGAAQTSPDPRVHAGWVPSCRPPLLKGERWKREGSSQPHTGT